jgi:hypothetical protein
MKKIISYITLSSIFLLIACQDDFLNEVPTNVAKPEAILVNKNGAQVYTNGAYTATRDAISSGMPGWLNIWGVLGADEIVVPGWSRFIPIYMHSIAPSNQDIETLWQRLYVSLGKVNSVVDRVGAMTEDQILPTDRDKLVAEARFLRAIINFALVSSWENVPLIKNESISFDNLDVFQASPLEVYKFIEADLIFAKEHLESSQGGGRATKGAAQALLGKVYLQMTGHPIKDEAYFEKAEVELKEVIYSGTYELMTYYPDIFTEENEQNQEIIFSFGFDGPGMDQGSGLGTLYGPPIKTSEGGASGNNWFVNLGLSGTDGVPNWRVRPNGPLWKKGGLRKADNAFAQPYSEDDIRSRNNISKIKNNKQDKNKISNWPESLMFGPARFFKAYDIDNWKPWKWHNIRNSNWGNDTPIDEIYIRYADVLLMYAEALNGQDKLTQDDADMTINLLRARARVWPDEVKTGVAADLVVGTKQHNKDEILSERRKELCFEGWRRNDLVRNGVYYEAINVSQDTWSNGGNPKTQFNADEIRWPIPLTEINLNPNLIQNKGY